MQPGSTLSTVAKSLFVAMWAPSNTNLLASDDFIYHRPQPVYCQRSAL